MATTSPGHEAVETAELTVLPRYAVRLPFELPLPEGFDPARPEAWPKVDGRLEYVAGRLLYMPPCGDEQQGVAVDVATELNRWRRTHRDYFVGGNEAGMMLGGDVRGADAAVWLREEVLPLTGGFVRRPPILAVEIAGRDELPEALEPKARWYLAHGVKVVWILSPRTRTVRVVTPDGATDHVGTNRLPEHPSLPGLSPRVDDLFAQLAEG